jgi:hypothetical protein
MGLFSKAAIVGAGYYAYKHHQDKKKAQRGEVDFSNQNPNPNQKRDLSPNNNYYPNDNKSQYGGGNPDYYRDTRDSRAQLDYPQHQQNGNPSYSSFGTAGKQEYASGAKY